ncbi:MAG: hypothetical protein CBD49_01005 [Acidimicrobiaceae bacterium TMED189]|nr:MAG: hypothetical protein CBD49_01005 [Acidimicrobiaceae bacterium TMED189]
MEEVNGMRDGTWLCLAWISANCFVFGFVQLYVFFVDWMRWRRNSRLRGPAYWDAMLANERNQG